MEKDSRRRRMVFKPSPVLCLLTLPLLSCAFSFTAKMRGQLSSWSFNLASNKGLQQQELLRLHLRRLVRGEDQNQLEAPGFVCYNELHSGFCIVNKRVSIDTNTSTIYISPNQTLPHGRLGTQPYARKEDETAMKLVTPVQIYHGNISQPSCHDNHDVPVVVFSSGGFTGNLFHEINEIIIPLFITCHHFHSHLRFYVTDLKPWFVQKYSRIISHLSPYEVIIPTSDKKVHCFTGAVVGLKYHDNLALNTTEFPKGYSMLDFKKFLKEAYSLRIDNAMEIKKPVLLLISRERSRMFLNENEMVGMMEELGLRVVVSRPESMYNLDKFSNVVNSCNIMVGAHGAGVTNELFLPNGAVLVQVVPLGLDWASKTYYGDPSYEMGLQYLEYKIEAEESSLVDIYGRNHPVIVNPASVFSKGYQAARAVYVDEQNLNINLVRFKNTLVQALTLIRHSTPSSSIKH